MKTITIASKVYGTNAERLAMNLTENETEICFYETDTNAEYAWKGSKWVQTSVNGAVSVTTMPGGIPCRYEKDALDGTAITITLPFACKALIIQAFNEDPDDLYTTIAYVLDPVSAAFRDAALTAGTGISQRDILKANGGKDEMVFVDGNGASTSITTIGLKRDMGTDAVRVVITGIGA